MISETTLSVGPEENYEYGNVKTGKHRGVKTKFHLNRSTVGTIYQNVTIKVKFNDQPDLDKTYLFVESWRTKKRFTIESGGLDYFLVPDSMIHKGTGKVDIETEAWFIEEDERDKRFVKGSAESPRGELFGIDNQHIAVPKSQALNTIQRRMAFSWEPRYSRYDYLGSNRCKRTCRSSRCHGMNKRNETCCLCTSSRSKYCHHHRKDRVSTTRSRKRVPTASRIRKLP
jgi:hypothetical protein